MWRGGAGRGGDSLRQGYGRIQVWQVGGFVEWSSSGEEEGGLAIGERRGQRELGLEGVER